MFPRQATIPPTVGSQLCVRVRMRVRVRPFMCVCVSEGDNMTAEPFAETSGVWRSGWERVKERERVAGGADEEAGRNCDRRRELTVIR